MSGRDKATNQLENFRRNNGVKNHFINFIETLSSLFKMVETLTTGHGAPVADKLNSMTAGPRGPLLIQVNFFNEDFQPHSNFYFQGSCIP